MNYNHLRYFRAVAREGNLTRAAEKLNLSQSALSVQVKALEQQLGHDLFERVGRSLVLTEAGRIALDHAETIFRTGEELLSTLDETGRARKALRVGALSTLSRNFQIEFLRPLIGRADVEVVLRAGSQGELLRELENLGLDLVLTTQAPPRDAASALVSREIAEQPVSLIGTPARVEGRDGVVELLRDNPLILPTVETGVREAFDALCDGLDLRPQIAAEVDDISMMRLLAREDAGLAVLPTIAVQDELASGALVEALHLPDIRERFHAVTLRRRFPNPLLNEVLNL